MKDDILKNNTELKEIYNKLEQELSRINPGCDACGTCCHFDEFDHVLYTSNIETDYIVNNVNVPHFDKKQNICPFLIENKCTIRDYRALGCRVFFCNPHYKETSQEIYNKYYNMIKKIAIKNQIDWQYAPMLELLDVKKRT